jgi:hypothetical protein
MSTTFPTPLAAATDSRRQQAYARLAGFLYLFVMASFLIGIVIAARFIVPGDLAASARHIAASESLYRVGLTFPLIGSVATVLLGGAFFALLRRVDEDLALFALLWRVAEATLGGMVTVFQFVALENYLASLSAGGDVATYQLAKLLLSTGYRACFHISIIFFSMGSIVFFALLHKSRFIPRPLSALGIVASVLAAMLGVAYLIAPQAVQALQWAGWAPIFAAEVGTGLWLLIKGADLQSRPAARPS